MVIAKTKQNHDFAFRLGPLVWVCNWTGYNCWRQIKCAFTGLKVSPEELLFLRSYDGNAAKFGTHLVTTFFFFFFLDLALQTLFRVSLNWWWLSAKKYFHHENILFSNFVQVIFYTHHKVCDQISAKRRDYIIKCVCVHILQHSIKWDGYTCGLFVINIH